jgi:hypothetical protein
MKNRLKIFHVRDDKRAMTVAAEVQPSEHVGGATVKLGFAFCNDKDNFTRRIGAAKAVGRMRSSTHSITRLFTGHSADAIADAFNKCSTDIVTAQVDMPKPHKWRHGRLANIEQAGLTFVEQVKVKVKPKEKVKVEVKTEV